MKKALLTFLLLLPALFSLAQPTLVSDIASGSGSSDPTTLQILNGKLYFNAATTANGRELWSYDPMTGATSLVYNIAPGNASSIQAFDDFNDYNGFVMNGKLYFAANDQTNGEELWVYDGTNAPTMAAEIFNGIAGGNPSYFLVHNNKLYFSAMDLNGGRELWVYDAGLGSASMAADVFPGITSSDVSGTVVFNNKMYFSAYVTATGTELYYFDPSVPASGIVSDIVLGGGDSNPMNLLVHGNKLYFTANTSTHGWEMYSYTGTGAPVRITDVNANTGDGVSNTETQRPIVFNGKIYFAGDDGTTGMELFVLDPNNNTVQLVADINPGATGSLPGAFCIYANKLYFNAFKTGSGAELWVYDGTNTPAMVGDLNAGAGSSTPLCMKVLGDTMYLNASDGSTGFELYKYYDAAASIQKVGFNADIKVYPVPTTEDAVISISDNKALSFRTEVRDVTGKLVYATEMTEYAAGENTIKIPLRNAAAGNYTFKLVGKDGSLLAGGKMVKQ